jgi:monofunctional biosynthetic peptidoglycan transglycosylase
MAVGKHKKLVSMLVNSIAKLAAGLFVLSVLAVLLLRFVPPPTSAFMLERHWQGIFGPGGKTPIEYQWTTWRGLSPQMALAAVAAEDQKFPHHFGFDFEAIADALEDIEEGSRFRGASTISQQVAKNLFLWKGRSFLRKGLEAYFTVLIEALWPKRRILEVYLNVAEFGDGIYGLEAAAQRYFGKPAAKLTRKESALLAAVLPNPKQFKVAAPSLYVRLRAMRIEKQMKTLGAGYLKAVWNGS